MSLCWWCASILLLLTSQFTFSVNKLWVQNLRFWTSSFRNLWEKKERFWKILHRLQPQFSCHSVIASAAEKIRSFNNDVWERRYSRDRDRQVRIVDIWPDAWSASLDRDDLSISCRILCSENLSLMDGLSALLSYSLLFVKLIVFWTKQRYTLCRLKIATYISTCKSNRCLIKIMISAALMIS